MRDVIRGPGMALLAAQPPMRGNAVLEHLDGHDPVPGVDPADVLAMGMAMVSVVMTMAVLVIIIA